MSAISEIAQSLRLEFDANLRAQRSLVRQQVGSVKRELGELRAEHELYHAETTRGLAHVGDELAALRAIVEPIVAARARRARVANRLSWLVTSGPGLITTTTSIAGAIAAAIALF